MVLKSDTANKTENSHTGNKAASEPATPTSLFLLSLPRKENSSSLPAPIQLLQKRLVGMSKGLNDFFF